MHSRDEPQRWSQDESRIQVLQQRTPVYYVTRIHSSTCCCRDCFGQDDPVTVPSSSPKLRAGPPLPWEPSRPIALPDVGIERCWLPCLPYLGRSDRDTFSRPHRQAASLPDAASPTAPDRSKLKRLGRATSSKVASATYTSRPSSTVRLSLSSPQ